MQEYDPAVDRMIASAVGIIAIFAPHARDCTAQVQGARAALVSGQIIIASGERAMSFSPQEGARQALDLPQEVLPAVAGALMALARQVLEGAIQSDTDRRAALAAVRRMAPLLEKKTAFAKFLRSGLALAISPGLVIVYQNGTERARFFADEPHYALSIAAVAGADIASLFAKCAIIWTGKG